MMSPVSLRRRWIRRALAAGFSLGLMFTAGHPSYYAAERFAYGRLVRVEGLPDTSGDMCMIPAAVQRAERMAVIQQRRRAVALGPETTIFAADPGRKVQDKYPAFAAIA